MADESVNDERLEDFKQPPLSFEARKAVLVPDSRNVRVGVSAKPTPEHAPTGRLST